MTELTTATHPVFTKEELTEIRSSDAHKNAFATALGIHRKEHEPEATHFRKCIECRCGYALLLIAGLEKELKSCQQT